MRPGGRPEGRQRRPLTPPGDQGTSPRPGERAGGGTSPEGGFEGQESSAFLSLNPVLGHVPLSGMLSRYGPRRLSWLLLALFLVSVAIRLILLVPMTAAAPARSATPTGISIGRSASTASWPICCRHPVSPPTWPRPTRPSGRPSSPSCWRPVFTMFGPTLLVARLMMAVLSALTAPLAFALASRLSSPRAGTIAGSCRRLPRLHPLLAPDILGDDLRVPGAADASVRPQDGGAGADLAGGPASRRHDGLPSGAGDAHSGRRSHLDAGHRAVGRLAAGRAPAAHRASRPDPLTAARRSCRGS